MKSVPIIREVVGKLLRSYVMADQFFRIGNDSNIKVDYPNLYKGKLFYQCLKSAEDHPYDDLTEAKEISAVYKFWLENGEEVTVGFFGMQSSYDGRSLMSWDFVIPKEVKEIRFVREN